jgi:glycosyltransferase involved in cell wall biosynthesis
MKICFSGMELAPLDGKNLFIGGTANNVVRLSRALKRRGHETYILSPTRARNLCFKKELKSSTGIIFPIPVYSSYASPLYGLESSIKMLYTAYCKQLQEKFDIINIHTGYSLVGVLGSLLSPLVSIPMILTIYSVWQEGGYYSIPHIQILRIFESKSFLSRVKKIITVSENIKNILKRKGISDQKIVCIPPAIDPEKFKPDIPQSQMRDKFGLEKDVIIVLYVGSWSRYKGVDIVIEGVKNLFNKFPELRLLLCWGSVTDDSSGRIRIIEKIRRLGLSSKVIELGMLPNVAEIMAASDIVVVPYLTTYGIADRPMTIVEAMACGKPVIATGVGGVREVVQNGVTGLIVNPGIPSEIENALYILIEDKDYAKQIGQRAAKYVLQTHDVNILAPKLEEVYQEVLSS